MLHNVVGHNPTLCIRVSSLYRATKSFVVVITAGHNGASQLDAYPKTFARSIERQNLALIYHCISIAKQLAGCKECITRANAWTHESLMKVRP